MRSKNLQVTSASKMEPRENSECCSCITLSRETSRRLHRSTTTQLMVHLVLIHLTVGHAHSLTPDAQEDLRTQLNTERNNALSFEIIFDSRRLQLLL